MKIFATDLDGTLLAHVHVAGSTNMEALHRLHVAGYTLVIASGRHYNDIKGLGFQDLSPFIISLNGAMLHTSTGNLIAQHALSYDDAMQIITYCDQKDLMFLAYTQDHVYLHKPKQYLPYLYKLANVRAKTEEDIIKGLEYYDNAHNNLLPVTKEFLEQLRTDKNQLLKIEISHYDTAILHQLEHDLQGDYALSSSWPTNREFTARNVHKGNALATLCSYLGTELSNCVTIGDNRNDIEMITMAGTGIAMGNAEDCIKEISDYVTSTCEKHGVAKAISYILDQQTKNNIP